MLKIEKHSLGPIGTNAYIVADDETKDCVIIDPSDNPRLLLDRVAANGWNLQALWLTHAHWDHIMAVPGIIGKHEALPIYLHSGDTQLYNVGGGAAMFGLPVQEFPPITNWLDDVTELTLGNQTFKVMFVPGHAQGHVAFYHAESNSLFGGDVLFQMSIGRTDLPGGSFPQLMESIQTHFMPLPDDTDVYSGHGPNTTIGAERRMNPFING